MKSKRKCKEKSGGNLESFMNYIMNTILYLTIPILDYNREKI